MINVAAYKFISLPPSKIDRLKAQFEQKAQELGLKGTILLSPEGLNLFLAGTRQSVDDFLLLLTGIAEFSDLVCKESTSQMQPFRYLRVKIKKQIIPMTNDVRGPSQEDSRMSPRELKRWLDENRDFVLLDTRNDYEVKFGSFANARHLNIATFHDFPEAAQSLQPDLKTKPLVMFCTGGIRCEKAAPALMQYGFREVYQLDGGILKYFEECGGDHFDGECFVFDERIAVDSGLQETGTVQCKVCFGPVTLEEQRSSRYTEGKSCPRCFSVPNASTQIHK